MIDLEAYYSKKSLIDKYQVVAKTKRFNLWRRRLSTTKNNGSFIKASKPITRSNMFHNFLIKDRSVNVSLGKITGQNK